MKLTALRLAAVLLVLTLAGGTIEAQGGAMVFVNTTEDLPVEANHCLPGEICPLRSAIERIESIGLQGTVRACFEAGTPGAARCSPLAQPLSTEDPGYDPATGKWYFEFAESGLAYNLSEGGTTIDFSLDIEDWQSPADNKIVLTPGPTELDHAFIIESAGNAFRGFDIQGDYSIAAFVVREGLLGDAAANNQFGPGLAMYDLRPGVGIQIRDSSSTGNRVIGSWCGITGDGTERMPLQDDCVQITLGASQNTVGGPAESDRNVFAASSLGSGVSISEGANANVVQGNWLGLDFSGAAAGLKGGVTVKINSNNTVIADNTISGNELSGIALYDGSYNTSVRGNFVGLLPDASTCAGNGELGIQVNNGVSNSVIERNRVACNEKGGINVSGRSARGNKISRNSVWRNGGRAIEIAQGANGNVRPPKINSASLRRVIGISAGCSGGNVEVFSDAEGEAMHFEGEQAADPATGLFIFEPEENISHIFVTATCTDGNNNTSGLSEKVSIAGGVPTKVPTIPPPTPDPNSTDVPILTSVYIPFVDNQDGLD